MDALQVLKSTPSDKRTTNCFYADGRMCPVYTLAAALDPHTFIVNIELDNDGDVVDWLTTEASNLVQNQFNLDTDAIISYVDGYGWEKLIWEMEARNNRFTWVGDDGDDEDDDWEYDY